MQEDNRGKGRIQRKIAWILIFISIPLTILFGIYVLDNRKYYFISLLLIIYAIIPFFFVFERRRPQAREIVIIAVLSAIAVAGRAAFFFIPQFKPMAAVVIITGVCFGAESGFLVGAVSALISNFFFGQGPWTPWQMFCFGIIGFLAGVFYKFGIIKKTKVSLCVFGAIVTFFIYGGIINLSSAMLFFSDITMKSLMAVYASALWFDIIHASATAFFLFFLSQPMIEKLDRIKIKYGLME